MMVGDLHGKPQARIERFDRVLMRTQRMMKPDAYMKEHAEGIRAKAIVSNTSLPAMTSGLGMDLVEADASRAAAEASGAPGASS